MIEILYGTLCAIIKNFMCVKKENKENEKKKKIDSDQDSFLPKFLNIPNWNISQID